MAGTTMADTMTAPTLEDKAAAHLLADGPSLMGPAIVTTHAQGYRGRRMTTHTQGCRDRQTTTREEAGRFLVILALVVTGRTSVRCR